MKRKSLAVGIILLFIGVAVTSSVHNNAKALLKDDLVEFTIEACGISGFKPQTVTLTKQQTSEVEELFEEIKRNLDSATTKEETFAIFDQAVVNLDKYRLLGGMNVDVAQKLVKTGCCIETNQYRIIDRNNRFLNNSNYFCLITGMAKETRLLSVVELGFSTLCYFIFGVYLISHILSIDPAVFLHIISRLQTVSDLYHSVNSLRVMGTGVIAFGNSRATGGHIPPFYQYYPAEGWVTTHGMLGKKSWNGSFYGDIFGLFSFDPSDSAYYIGASGFLGIKIKQNDNGTLFFLGSAFRVKLNTNPRINR